MTSVLIVGGGAREHALAWKLCQSPDVDRLLVAPGNAGTASLAENLPVAATDVDAIARLVEDRDVDLTVVGPEAPLALGLADRLRAQGRHVVGPDAAAARIESSKAFAKDLMRRTDVPTAPYRVCDDSESAFRYLSEARYPLVIKADGLAAGKGVVICQDVREARAAVEAIMVDRVHGASGERVVIEEALCGPEISLLALVDGEQVVPLPIAQDHKRLLDGDLGPNTGGMGACAPVPPIGDTQRARLIELMMTPVVHALAQRGTPYRGILFAGLMLTPDGPRVLEYNCRLGDPEAQVILPLLDGDLLPWLEMAAAGTLRGTVPVLDCQAAGVVLAARGYPESPELGQHIEDLDAVPPDLLIFHGGTARDADGNIVTAGGRVLTIVALAATTEQAAQQAYAAPIHFPGMQRRSDIGRQLSAVSYQLSAISYQLSAGAAPGADGISRPSTLGGQSKESGRGRGDSAFALAAPAERTPTRTAANGGPLLPERGRAQDRPYQTLQAEGSALKTQDSRLKHTDPEGTPQDLLKTQNSKLKTPTIAVLASGEGSNLQALLDACAAGRLAAEIAVVVSHNLEAGALDRARRAGIPAVALTIANRRDPAQRRNLEEHLLATLAPYHVDLIVLAGWMLVLSASFLDRCGCPILNVHPALLPNGHGPWAMGNGNSGEPHSPQPTAHSPQPTAHSPQPTTNNEQRPLRGPHAVRDAIALGLTRTGVSVHVVTPAVDDGPVIASEPIDILPGDDEASLYRRIKPVEHRLLVQAVERVLSRG